jgi:hypothetical protein
MAVKLEQDLVPIDEGNGEEQVMSRLIKPIRSRDDIKWIISFVDCVGACVASILEEMEWNAQGKRIFVGYFISPIIGV